MTPIKTFFRIRPARYDSPCLPFLPPPRKINKIGKNFPRSVVRVLQMGSFFGMRPPLPLCFTPATPEMKIPLRLFRQGLFRHESLSLPSSATGLPNRDYFQGIVLARDLFFFPTVLFEDLTVVAFTEIRRSASLLFLRFVSGKICLGHSFEVFPP